MAAAQQNGRASGSARFPNPNTLLGFADPSGSPDPKYTQQGTGPRGGPGVSQQVDGPKPSNRSSSTAVPSADATEVPDRAGARLSVTTSSTAQRTRTLREFQDGLPERTDPLAPRESLGVVAKPYEGDKIWSKRAAQGQALHDPEQAQRDQQGQPDA